MDNKDNKSMTIDDLTTRKIQLRLTSLEEAKEVLRLELMEIFKVFMHQTSEYRRFETPTE